MKKLLIIIVFISVIFMPYNIMAKSGVNQPKILIIPFSSYSSDKDDVSHKKKEVVEFLKKQIKEAGAVVFTSEKYDSNIETDYVINGSITWLYDNFSIDVKLKKPLDDLKNQLYFSRSGKSIENLSAAVKNISDNIIAHIFSLDKIVDIEVQGNERIEADAIIKIISGNTNKVYSGQKISEYIKSIYKMGYFDDIRIEKQDVKDGKKIIIHVKEKPTLKSIIIKGNRIYEDSQITKQINMKKGSIINIFKMQKAVVSIKELYTKKNYHNMEVSYEIKNVKNNQANIEIKIKEGEKAQITNIEFIGNNVYPDKKLKKIIKTKEKGFFSWLTQSGDLKDAHLKQDISKLTAFYKTSGYIYAKIADPEIIYLKNKISIKIAIEEGERFKVGKIDITGDLIKNKKELLKNIKIKNEEFFNIEIMQKDVLELTDEYLNEGYAYTEIIPLTKPDEKEKLVNITYNINKKEQVFFEKIIISGNTKTRDKVIRRELNVYEQEIYGGKKLKKSIRNLNRLDYFENINLDTIKGSEPNSMILKINVEEKNTGMFTIGGGYDDVEKFYFMTSVSERNFFGRGQTLKLQSQLGGESTKYNLSFTEPWLLDMPLSATIDVFNWENDYDTYDKDSQGFGFRVGYPVFKDTRLYAGYRFEDADIKNIESDAPDIIKEMEGDNIESSVTLALTYDTRDQFFNATEGVKHSISVQYAGLGGDIGFTKYILDSGFYFPLFLEEITGCIHGKTGYIKPLSDKKLPTYERFQLGGMNSLRGFDYRDLSPKKISIEEGIDANGEFYQTIYTTYIGGNKFVQFNFEILYPLIEKAGLMGVIFYDMGNVYDNSESIDLGNLRQSAGFGIRWNSPMGPMRFEYGSIIHPEKGERANGKFEFAIGSAF
jgi:outer membrane protein insertion porin family